MTYAYKSSEIIYNRHICCRQIRYNNKKELTINTIAKKNLYREREKTNSPGPIPRSFIILPLYRGIGGGNKLNELEE
jgi:hypothetical protein